MFLDRLKIAVTCLPDLSGWWLVVGLLCLYATIALPLGFAFGLLQIDLAPLQPAALVRLLLTLWITPALLEELVFRVLWLPHPSQQILAQRWWLWASIGLILFILYHPLNAFFFYPPGRSVFYRPLFLFLAGLLGLACTFAYQCTGSLWAATVIHWTIVVVWLLGLGGLQLLTPSS
ncbi:hypothetical protein BST81_21525 [Leptolyngbya sp. 'hensonii']|nr:hypothetical protein BST81_21525 [Leptolyngbya sp. 'hensonii']